MWQFHPSLFRFEVGFVSVIPYWLVVIAVAVIDTYKMSLLFSPRVVAVHSDDTEIGHPERDAQLKVAVASIEYGSGRSIDVGQSLICQEQGKNK